MSTSFFKCNSCSIQFPNSDSQRFHMKTEWHRYNLKRRVAQLPPIDATVFSEKLQKSKQFEEETDEFGFAIIKPKEPKKYHINHGSRVEALRGRASQSSSSDPTRDISPASATGSELSSFSLGDSVYSHAGTHTDVDSDFETASHAGTDPSFAPSGDEAEDDEDDDDYETHSQHEADLLQPITSCIYCGVPHHDIETNLTHMFKSHGLYIPERTYLVDLKGLLEYLISIIVIDNECLCCNFKGRSLESIRAHLTSKGHCRLPYETREERAEFEQFYDFSSLNAVPEKARNTKKVGFSSADENNEGGDDTIVEDDGMGSNEDEVDDNGYALVHIDPIDSELALPNGNRLGHRQHQRIYRQTIALPREPSESRLTVSSADRRMATLPTFGTSKEEKSVRVNEQREQSRKVHREVKRTASNFQKHYRDPMLGG